MRLGAMAAAGLLAAATVVGALASQDSPEGSEPVGDPIPYHGGYGLFPSGQ